MENIIRKKIGKVDLKGIGFYEGRKKNKTVPEPDFDRGRGITKQTKIELKELERDEQGFTPENFRLKYVFKQKIKPECIVLHFTAISSF